MKSKFLLALFAIAFSSASAHAASIRGDGFTIDNVNSTYQYELSGDKLSFALDYFNPGKDTSGFNYDPVDLGRFNLIVDEGYILKSISIGVNGVGTLLAPSSRIFFEATAWNLITWNYWQDDVGGDPYISQAGIYYPVKVSSTGNYTAETSVFDVTAGSDVHSPRTPAINNLYSLFGSFVFNASIGATLQVNNLYWTFEVVPVPEPSTYAMLGLGLGVMGFAARRRKSA